MNTQTQESLKETIDEQIEWIDGWSKAYPESIFPSVTDEESQALEQYQKHLGMRIAAQMGRHIAKRFEGVIKTLNACKEVLESQEQEHKCSEHPDAPHGFCRDASHSAGRYVCECEGWEELHAQEPVAWMSKKRGDVSKAKMYFNEGEEILPLYTHPAPSWQGLSDYETQEIIDNLNNPFAMIRVAEMKLKEKNRV